MNVHWMAFDLFAALAARTATRIVRLLLTRMNVISSAFMMLADSKGWGQSAAAFLM